MKKSDCIVMVIVAIIIAVFACVPAALELFNTLTKEHGMVMSFIKFSILATFGEMLALRIRKGFYTEKGFGIAPRMLVWGILGMGIAMSMMIFKAGTVNFLTYLGIEQAAEWFAGGLSWGKLGVAFCVS